VDLILPKHVQACQHSANGQEKWFVWTWKRESPADQTRVPYSCSSWRCPICRRYEASVTFARIREATTPLEPTGFVYFVLTLDRNGYYSGKKWADVGEAYAAISTMTRKFLKRLRRRYSEIGNRWVAVVEAHKSGWPHVNLMIYCPKLAQELRNNREDALKDPFVMDAVQACKDAWKDGAFVPKEIRERARQSLLMQGDLLSHATECGWGRQSSAEAARDCDSVAGYLVKLAGNHDKSISEVAKLTQLPTNAPQRFRRLRSGKGFLPPRKSNPEITGCMIRRRRSDQGDWEIMKVNAPVDERQIKPIERAIEAEFALIEEEEDLLSRCKNKLPAMPHLRFARLGVLEGHKETSEHLWAMKVRAQMSA